MHVTDIKQVLTIYLPDLVMIISVPSSWNLSHSSLVSRLHEIFAISSLGMPGLVGMSGSVHTAGALPLKSPCPSRDDRSGRDCWLQEDFSTNCSFFCWEYTQKQKEKTWWFLFYFIFSLFHLNLSSHISSSVLLNNIKSVTVSMIAHVAYWILYIRIRSKIDL